MELKEKDIILWFDQHREEIANFCCELIKYKSITGDEKTIQREFLHKFVHEELKPDYDEAFSIDKEKDRPNVVAVWQGNGDGNSLLLNAHVDVVDVPENQLIRWKTDPWKPVIKNGNIYGRGASDMKGGITAMLWAIKALQELGARLDGTVGLELVVGEELMHHEVGTTAATKRLLEKGYNFDFCIDPEPTSCEVHTLSCGTFDFEVEVEGKEIHTANRNAVLYPQRWDIPCGDEVGVDAIAKIVEVTSIIRKIEKEGALMWRHPLLGGGGYPIHDDFQGVGSTFTLNISLIQGGTYIASVPGNAKITCQCYYPPWVKYEEVKEFIKKSIESYANIDSWLSKHPPKISFAKTFHWPPYETSIDHPACKALGEAYEQILQKKAIYSGFKAVDDVTFVQAFGIPGVSFGPGDLSMGVHGPNEYVPISQILDCAKTLTLFLLQWCRATEHENNESKF